MNDEKRAELLMDHYKDTFQLILYHWKVRNRLFIYILIVLALMALDIQSPGALSQMVNAYVAKKLEVTGKTAPALDFSAVGAMAWFLLLCLVIHYYQRSIHVERQYRYIDNLEQQICSIMGGDYVTREGRAYMTTKGVYKQDQTGKRPLYLRAVGPLYVYFFPALLTLFILFKLCKEGFAPAQTAGYFNVLFGVVIVLYSVFYVIWVKFRR